MTTRFNRRQAVKTIVAASVATAIPKTILGAAKSPQAGALTLEVQIPP